MENEDPLDLTIHHVTYSVRDVDALSTWWADVLGFKIRRRFDLQGGSVRMAWLDLGDVRVGMVQTAVPPPASPRYAMASEALRVSGPAHLIFTVANVDEAYARLEKRGVDCLDPPASFDPPGIRIAYFADPEGNVLGVYQDLDPANAIAGAS